MSKKAVTSLNVILSSKLYVFELSLKLSSNMSSMSICQNLPQKSSNFKLFVTDGLREGWTEEQADGQTDGMTDERSGRTDTRTER